MSTITAPCIETRLKAGNSFRQARAVIVSVMGVAAIGGVLSVLPVQAFEFGDDELQGSLDVTVSHGITYRVEEPNHQSKFTTYRNFPGYPENRNDGLTADANGNDGNLNYDKGIASNVSKFVADLDLRKDNLGLFVRTAGFFDFENERSDRLRTPLSDAAMERVGSNVEVLDAYFTAGYDYNDTSIDFRLGKHVLNWGESTFIPNGINAINPYDVSKLMQPGSELREALLPVGMASVSVEPSDTLSFTGFYQYDWEETRINPVGSFFSSTDYVGPGADKAVLTNLMEAFLPDQPHTWDRGLGQSLALPTINPLALGIVQELNGYNIGIGETFDANNFAIVPRGDDWTPESGGQYGLAMNYFAENLNETEFGFYFINYHSRLPTVTARTPSPEALRNAVGAANAIATGPTAAAFREQIQPQVLEQVTAQVQSELMAGMIYSDVEGEIEMRAAEQIREQIGNLAALAGIDHLGQRGSYHLQYPEDLQLYGLSFNTVLGSSGWALQGEYSFRPDAPLQRAERRVLQDGIQPAVYALTLQNAAVSPTATPEDLQAYQEYLNGGYQPHVVAGYVERDVSQIQATATKLFGPTLGADALVFVGEAAVMHVHDMPSKRENPLESPAGGILPAPHPSVTSEDPKTPHEADADATSWGYRVAVRLDYYNAINSINLYPYAQFLHDVSGNSPAPSGPFVEGRTAITLGLQADYLSRWQADFGYTQYGGDGNELSDRDFISASLKYSF